MTRRTDIVSQFTKMADAFASARPIVDRQALDLLLDQTNASSSDDALDVACGAGIVACHFASIVNTARGIDITPAMIRRAKALQARQGVANVAWDIGDVTQLPYARGSFSIVTSRYAFHHMMEPGLVLSEMMRVCRVGGVVAVADICVSEDARRAERFNELETLNDPTHVRALSLSEHLSLFRRIGLSDPAIANYMLEIPLLLMLEAAGRDREEALEIETLVRASIEDGMLGGNDRRDGDVTMFPYPIVVLSACKLDGPR